MGRWGNFNGLVICARLHLVQAHSHFSYCDLDFRNHFLFPWQQPAFRRPKYSTRRTPSALLRIPIIVERTQLTRALKSSFRMSLLAFRSSA